MKINQKFSAIITFRNVDNPQRFPLAIKRINAQAFRTRAACARICRRCQILFPFAILI